MKRIVADCLVSIDLGADRFSAAYRFPATLELFAGHFPGSPLVPGVVLIEAVRIAAERVRGTPLDIVRIRDARFAQPVLPDETVVVEGELDGCRCRATLPGGTRIDIEFAAADC